MLTKDQVATVRRALAPASYRPEDADYDQQAAEWLVTHQILNRWQAEQLLRGRTKFNLGPYRILDAIGYGGMGYVFKGEHSLLGRIEAIKVLPRNQMDPGSIAAFCREIRAQAQLDHPNLVRLSFADREGDTYYLVTEYVPGADLRRLVRFHGPLSGQQAALVVSQAAEALAYAHTRGLVHRDVKPGNLLVTPDGHTKLTDLGLAAFTSEERSEVDDVRRGALVGTPDFVAPESIMAPSEIRRTSDVYSLGCTMYYAVTGKVPFPGGKTRDKLRRHLGENPLTPLRFAPNLDPRLVEVIAEMMAKQSERRIASASQVVERLRPWTSAVEEVTWQELGRFAVAPGERSFTGAALADTAPAVTQASLGSNSTLASEVRHESDAAHSATPPNPLAPWTEDDQLTSSGIDLEVEAASLDLEQRAATSSDTRRSQRNDDREQRDSPCSRGDSVVESQSPIDPVDADESGLWGFLAVVLGSAAIVVLAAAAWRLMAW
ncbi:MAG: serine/threonine protein kinase [Planctomycetales bacterium]|nr:serine/threonine protein kinase [Planctomycetales bacterium]